MKRMTSREFVRRVRRLGRERGVAVRFDAKRGKGSHGRLTYGTRGTTVKDLKKELRTGTLAAMCRQLGIDPGDL